MKWICIISIWLLNLPKERDGSRLGTIWMRSLVYKWTSAITTTPITLLIVTSLKQDKDAVHSRGHPDLLDAVPRTEQAITSRKKKAKQKGKCKRKRRAKASEHLSVYHVCEIVQAKGITSRLQLVCLAVQQNREGKTSLAQFIANRGNKAVDEAISLAREFSQAESLYLRAGKTRIQLLEEERAGECAADCDGNWQTAATQLLASQGITKGEFCSAIHTALAKGRGKYQNVFIDGPTNCGKSFILSPLKVIYKAFCNPATGSFAWIGAEDAEIIYLNDFRWHPKIISWADLLLALEGDTVHLPAPKNLYNKSWCGIKQGHPLFRNLKRSHSFSQRRVHWPHKHRNDECKVALFPLLASNPSREAATVSALWSLFQSIYLGKHRRWRYFLK